MYTNTTKEGLWLDYNVVRPMSIGDYKVKVKGLEQSSYFDGVKFTEVDDDDEVTHFYSDKYLQDVPDMKEWLEIL